MDALTVVDVGLWDGVAPQATPARTLRIEAGRIAAIGGPDDVPALASGARVLRFAPGARATALPGLIDAHVHLTLDPSRASAAEQIAAAPGALEQDMAGRALAMARAGITTARDCGGGAWLELGLRDRIAAGAQDGPRLVCAGQPVTSPGGHCHFWGGEAQGEAELREVVRRQVGRRADWIKVMATGGVLTPGSGPRAPQFEIGALRSIVEEAAAHGRPVAAHCHGTEGIRRAARAGVRTLEHCSFAGARGFGDDWDPELARRLAVPDLWVSPTVNAGWARHLDGRDGRPAPFARRMGRALRGLREAGARFVASTDAGIPGVAHDRLAEGLAVFARLAGLSPRDALRAAGAEAARALGLAHETGVLRAGLAADVLVVAGNPLQDLAALTRPLFVAARGRIVREPPAAGAAAPGAA